LVEQNTEPYEIERQGVEDELPPGKVVIAYDDTKHTKTTAYSGKDGALTSTLTYDTTEAVTEMVLQTDHRSTDAKLQCEYDSRGNWTSCQLVVIGAGISKVGRKWRRTITYR
jgi:hypothetical protein